MPLIYTLILVIETGWLIWRYATDPPSSSEPLSIALGWGGLISMVVMLVYSFARRSRALRRIARLSYWLHFHIWLGFQGMIMVLFHSMPMFLGEGSVMVLNPGVLNFIAVVIVFSSGIFGRYLYSLLPRTLGGEQMVVREVEAELAKLPSVPADVEALWKGSKQARSFRQLISANRQTRAALRKLSGLSLSPELSELARRRLLLEHRRLGLVAAQRIFHNWIILHRPIAAMMYVLSFVHVMLVYMFTPSLGS